MILLYVESSFFNRYYNACKLVCCVLVSTSLMCLVVAFCFLGLETYENISSPTLVKGDIEGEKIVSISSRADTVLAVSGDFSILLRSVAELS